jgi:hypothetical protein
MQTAIHRLDQADALGRSSRIAQDSKKDCSPSVSVWPPNNSLKPTRLAGEEAGAPGL